MRLVTRLGWVVSLPVFLLGGCQEVATSPGSVEIRLVVKDSLDQTPLEDAQICEEETGRCVPSDASGFATFELPANREVSFTVEKEGYGPILYPVATGVDGTSANLDCNMGPDAWLADTLANLESSYPLRDTGMILVVIIPRFAGVTLELVDATGKAFYKDEEDNFSLDLEATTAGGFGREQGFAEGGFVEVGPGEFQLEIGGTASDCALFESGGTRRGWPGDVPNTIRMPVREGFQTRAVVSCPPP
jgi:hypothetical protein